HALCWLRRDLRLKDHRALMEACKSSERVTLVFVFDTTILRKLKDKNDRRVTFIFNSVQEIDQKLRERGSALVILFGDPREKIPSLAKKISAEAIFCNHDYEPLAKKRDEAIAQTLKSMKIEYHHYKDQVIFESLEVATKSGEPFRRFTPYKNAWINEFTSYDSREFRPDLKKLTPKKYLNKFLNSWTLNDIGFQRANLWLEGGEEAANKRLMSFQKKLDDYSNVRDFPSIKGTSGLSAHLRFGTISIRKLVRMAKKSKSEGAKVWMSEIIWRDFYQMVLDQYPKVTTSTFQPQYNSIKWPGSDKFYRAWCCGNTGYPLIDAAMRHFNETGWIHNRLRMIAASFLVKDLLVDWRKGEAYFSRFLLDFDLAANNGGWQWCASTGCDAQPWFRIFNPVTQSKRFDPDGKFIRSVLPELSGFSNKDIHFPFSTSLENQEKAFCIIGKDYPKPIVDHALQRNCVLKIFNKFQNK
ncbi:MAG: deoxyribodipyrimidine photo-lyase, partial [Nitrospinota bacterium]